MNAGRLREKIRIEHVETVRKGLYGEQMTETTVFSTRADIRHDRGVRVAENGEIFHSYDVTFIVWDYVERRISDYDTVIWKDTRYTIQSHEHVREAKLLYIKATKENE